MAGTLVADTLQDGAGNSTSMDNAIYGSAKAWVKFLGGSSSTNQASYNVSSITYVSVGNYTVNFTNALPDTNYAVLVSANLGASPSGNANNWTGWGIANTTSSCKIYGLLNAGTLSDGLYFAVAIFR